MSICSIEDVAEQAGPGFWFQLYVMRDRAFIERLIARQGRRLPGAGADAGPADPGPAPQGTSGTASTPPRPTLANLLDIATKPRWALGMLGTKRRQFGNVVGHVSGIDDMSSLSEWTASQFDPTLDWDAVRWIRRRGTAS